MINAFSTGRKKVRIPMSEIDNTDDLEEEEVEEEESDEESETEVDETETESDEEEVEEDTTDWKAEALKYKAIADRKDKKAKKVEKPEPKEEETKITPLDTIALMKADVTEEDDIQEVIDYAGYKKISVTEALKSPVVKTTLADRAEERKTAKATNTKGGKRGTAKQSAESIIQQARDGKEVDPEKLAEARMNIMLKERDENSK